MKEAAGEANLTVVAIILIGIVLAFATPLIKNTLNNTEKRTECIENGGEWNNGKCDVNSD